MAMKSDAGSKITLEAEVIQIDKRAVWLLIGEKESFLPFDNFPLFRDGSVGAIQSGAFERKSLC
jgi:hypothetical protein